MHRGERTTGDAPAPWDHYIALLVLLLLLSRPPTAILTPSFITGVTPYLHRRLCLYRELCRDTGLDPSPKVSCGRARLRRQDGGMREVFGLDPSPKSQLRKSQARKTTPHEVSCGVISADCLFHRCVHELELGHRQFLFHRCVHELELGHQHFV